MDNPDRKYIIHWLGMGKDARDRLLSQNGLALHYGLMPWSALPDIVKTLIRKDTKE